MSSQTVPLPGTPAGEWIALADQERSLAGREAQLHTRGAEVDAAARKIQVRLDAARANLQKLIGTAVRSEAEDVFANAMAIAVPQHAASPAAANALALRRQALAARTQAIQSEEAAVKTRSDSLQSIGLQIEALEAMASQMSTKLAKLAAEAAQAAKAAEAARVAAPKPMAAPVPPPMPRAAAAPAPAAPAPAPMNAGDANRRASPRVKLHAEINMASDSNFFAGFSEDISETGVFVATYAKLLPPGTPIDLSLTLPSRPPIKVSGVVKWVREPREDTPGVFPGMGVAFQGLNLQDANTVREFIKARDPLFWTD